MPPLTAELTRGVGVSHTRGEGDGSPAGPSGSELIGLGLSLAAAVLLPLFVGIGIDAVLNVSPIGLLAGLALGVTAASVVVFQRFKRYMT